jgi:tRNA threonylcarbamoyladenosine biosynthesis protein TsaB
MNILALDTCFGALSVAARWRDSAGQPRLHGVYETCDRGHAERLMPMIAGVMATTGLTFSDLDRIAVTVGPGTFSGVRVGIAAARGLALATGVSLAGATSLEVMARQAAERLRATRGDRLLAVAVDARRHSVYFQLLHDPGDPAGPLQLIAPKAAAELVGSRGVVVVGSGAQLVADAVGLIGGDAEALLGDLQPDARCLASMASDLAPAGSLRPLYLKAPDVKPPSGQALPRAAS